MAGAKALNVVRIEFSRLKVNGFKFLSALTTLGPELSETGPSKG
jgi:hypothetical protein